MLLERDPTHAWFDFVLHTAPFNEFVKSLLDYRMAVPLACPGTNVEANQVAKTLCSEVLELLDKPEVLISLAEKRLEQGQTEAAVQLLVQALAQRADISQEPLDKVLRDNRSSSIPTALRKAALQFLFGPVEQ